MHIRSFLIIEKTHLEDGISSASTGFYFNIDTVRWEDVCNLIVGQLLNIRSVIQGCQGVSD